MRYLPFVLAVNCGPAFADELPAGLLDRAGQAAIIVIGEIHDNPAHHDAQAAIVSHIQPAAIVFEMLTGDQAARVKPDNRMDQSALADDLDWDGSGWPDFAMYYPVFVAAPQAAVFGAAVPRDAARAAMQAGIADSFGDGAADYGLTGPLPPDVQAQQEDLQQQAHCNAMPPEMLPVMVDIQRLRDAVLARETLTALTATGGPVVVITGNGHARADGGLPSYISVLRPDVEVLTIGQQEHGIATPGRFDVMLSAPAIDRPDPCLPFRSPD